MNSIGKCVLLAGLLISAGCTNNEVRPEPVKKTAAVKPADDVPEPVAKLLPVEQLNERNGNPQAQAMYDVLKKEKAQAGRTESAKNE